MTTASGSSCPQAPGHESSYLDCQLRRTLALCASLISRSSPSIVNCSIVRLNFREITWLCHSCHRPIHGASDIFHFVSREPDAPIKPFTLLRQRLIAQTLGCQWLMVQAQTSLPRSPWMLCSSCAGLEPCGRLPVSLPGPGSATGHNAAP